MVKNKLFLAVVAFVGLSVGLTSMSASPSDKPTSDKPPEDVDVKLHKECLYPVVQLLEIGKTSGATGFVVRSEKIKENVYYNMFLTCAHCVSDDDQEVAVFLYEDWSYVRTSVKFPCTFYGVDSDLDLAVGYFLSDQPVPTVKLCMDCKMYIGSDLFKIGCGVGQVPRVEFGKVNRPVRKTDIGEKFIRHSATTIPGDSGGPVFYKHKVVGMANRIQVTKGTPVFNFAYAIPIGRFYEWSKTNEGFYDHIFEATALMPRMPQYRLEVVNRYEIVK